MKHEVTTYNTKRMLAESLKKVMRAKPFSKITVSEIIRDCGVNRKTFYYHFQDIYALLKWVIGEEALQMVRHFDLLIDYEEAIRFVMDYVLENDYIISCVHDAIGREEMKRFFYIDFINVVMSVIEEAEENTGFKLDPEFKRYAASFYTEALASMLIDWAREGRHQDKEKTIRYLTQIIGANMENMVVQMRNQSMEKE